MPGRTVPRLKMSFGMSEAELRRVLTDIAQKLDAGDQLKWFDRGLTSHVLRQVAAMPTPRRRGGQQLLSEVDIDQAIRELEAIALKHGRTAKKEEVSERLGVSVELLDAAIKKRRAAIRQMWSRIQEDNQKVAERLVALKSRMPEK